MDDRVSRIAHPELPLSMPQAFHQGEAFYQAVGPYQARRASISSEAAPREGLGEGNKNSWLSECHCERSEGSEVRTGDYKVVGNNSRKS